MSNAYFHKGKPISQASNLSEDIRYNETNVKKELDDINKNVNDVTRNIQLIENTYEYDLNTLNAKLEIKQPTITGGATTITSSNLTANRALISNGNGKVSVSAVTNTELGYLDGVTSNIQTQLNKKQDASTAITTSNISDQSVAYAASSNVAQTAHSANNANYASNAGTVGGKTFTWSGQSGMPNWVWGGNNSDGGTKMYVWNPANFTVYAANNATGNLATALNSKMSNNPNSIEIGLNGGIGLKYIDFHLDGSTVDYTHRLITGGWDSNMVAYPGISNGSDRRLKEDIESINDIYIEILKKLNPVQYRYKKSPNKLRLGFIAQEVNEIFDEYNMTEAPMIDSHVGLFAKDSEVDKAEYYTLDYNQFVPIVVKAIQDLYREIDELKIQIKNKKGANNE